MKFLFDLSWFELSEAKAANAKGETVSMTIPFARTISCDTYGDAYARREWHLAHMADWLPPRTVTDVPGREPEVGEIRKHDVRQATP